MIKRLLAAAAVILLSACASTADDDDWAELVTGPKTPLCDAATYPPYANGSPQLTPMLCNSSMVNLLAAGPGERAYRALWMDGDEMGGFGSLEVRSARTGPARPDRPVASAGRSPGTPSWSSRPGRRRRSR